jgi:hypothetical protein
MNLTQIRPDDIVRVDRKGRVFEALVLARRRGELQIRPIQPGVTFTRARAREVICHWSKRGRPRRSRARAAEAQRGQAGGDRGGGEAQR